VGFVLVVAALSATATNVVIWARFGGHPSVGTTVFGCPNPNPVATCKCLLAGLQQAGIEGAANEFWMWDPTYSYNGVHNCLWRAPHPAGGFSVSGRQINPWSFNTTTQYFPPKNNGGSCPKCGNPINPGAGNKYQIESDYSPPGVFAPRWGRTYNNWYTYHRTQIGVYGPLAMDAGTNWQFTYGQGRTVVGTDDGALVTVGLADGRFFYFEWNGSAYVSDADISHRLQRLTDAGGLTTGWKLTTPDVEDVETYDANGRLLSIQNRAGMTQTLTYSDASTPVAIAPAPGLVIGVTDHFGRQLQLRYDANRRIVKMIDFAGGEYVYTYDTSNGLSLVYLASVTFPDGKVRTYLYNEPAYTNNFNLLGTLTGLVDENGSRFASWTYDIQYRATSSERAGGVERVTINYGGTTTVTDALNTGRTFGYSVSHAVARSTGVSGPDGPVDGPAVQSHDSNGNAASRTDWNGNRTDYTYDPTRNLETQRVEGLTAAGAPTAQTRTINTQWHATLRLPTAMAEPLRRTTYVYNGDAGANCGTKLDGVTLVPGVLCSKTVQATADANGSQGFSATPVGTARTWIYTYNHNGLVLTADGSRTDVSDVTSYTYYADNDPDLGKRGNVATVTNAAGHVTTITAYNAHGQPLSMTDANGLVTTMTYDARLRLTSRDVGGEVTSYEYDGVGQLTKVTLPDGSFLAYTYDAAHRLTAMQDSLGNRVAYTLDAMGNRTLEEVRDPANVLAQTRSRVYSNLNRLFQEVGAAGQTTEYTYDNQGNVTAVKDPLNRVTANQYDALNRLKQVTDPASGVTQYGYNALDALTSVSDPRSLVTNYTVDGLGNLTQQVSPDTGTTASTYDAAGNLATQTDAKGQVTTYTYDALNRVTLITFHDGSKQAYAYDAGTNGLGRLTGITETNPALVVTNQIAYAYDQKGRVVSETRTLGGVAYVTAYAFDAAGRMSGVTYPSGRTVEYAFDGLGRVSQVSTTKDATTGIVAQNIQYHPFGAARSWTLGNGQFYTRVVDLDGRIGSYTLGAAVYALAYDAASRITSIGETANPPNTNAYGYDALDRLTSAILPASNYGYGYDAVGNRTTKTTGAATDTYAYGAASNRIASLTPASGPVRNFVFDANGSTTSDAVNAFGYDARGRMVSATGASGATAYQVNALGQRVRKTNAAGDVVFHYDTRGRLIAETDPAGVTKREYLYLGDTPIGVVQ